MQNVPIFVPNFSKNGFVPYDAACLSRLERSALPMVLRILLDEFQRFALGFGADMSIAGEHLPGTWPAIAMMVSSPTPLSASFVIAVCLRS